MRTVAVHALPLEPGATLRRVPTWRALPEPGDAVTVVRHGSGERWTGRVVAVDAETGTYTVRVERISDASSN